MRSAALTPALILALAGWLVACSPGGENSATPSKASATAPASLATLAGQHYSNAFAYCRAIGTIDQPDSRYTGPNPPPAVIDGLMAAFGAPPTATRSRAFSRGTSWRCMDHDVYACTVGANLPCQSQADTDRTPTEAENKYCAAHHDATIIPMYVTGHNTVYDWHCEGKKPVAGQQLTKVDQRGFLANIWYKIPSPNQSGP